MAEPGLDCDDDRHGLRTAPCNEIPVRQRLAIATMLRHSLDGEELADPRQHLVGVFAAAPPRLLEVAKYVPPAPDAQDAARIQASVAFVSVALHANATVAEYLLGPRASPSLSRGVEALPCRSCHAQTLPCVRQSSARRAS